jgi:hypothetical protein
MRKDTGCIGDGFSGVDGIVMSTLSMEKIEQTLGHLADSLEVACTYDLDRDKQAELIGMYMTSDDEEAHLNIAIYKAVDYSWKPVYHEQFDDYGTNVFIEDIGIANFKNVPDPVICAVVRTDVRDGTVYSMAFFLNSKNGEKIEDSIELEY